MAESVCFLPCLAALPQGDVFRPHSSPISPWPFPAGGQLAGPLSSLSTGPPHPWPHGADKVARSRPHKANNEQEQLCSGPKDSPPPLKKTKENKTYHHSSQDICRIHLLHSIINILPLPLTCCVTLGE